MADGFTFDPARDGFGFRNPTGRASDRTGGGRTIRRSDAFVYGKGICFGMAAAVLLGFSGEAKGIRPPLADLSLSPTCLPCCGSTNFGSMVLLVFVTTLAFP